MLALLLEGRLLETLPVRPLVLAEGRSLTVGRVLTDGRLLEVAGLLTLPLALGRSELVLLTVGRAEAVPLLALTPALLELPDMLPLVPLRPSCTLLWLIEPAVLLPWRTLAT